MKEEFIEWCEENKIELDLTQSQAKLLDFLLNYTECISGIGDMWKPIRVLQAFINR